MRILFFLLASTLLFSCGRENLQYKKDYFDFDSLINQQIKVLAASNISIHKNASITDSTTTGMAVADSAALARELDIFRQIDLINRPLFKGKYAMSEGPDTRSNLIVRTYSPTIPSPIKEVRFYFLENFKRLKRIEVRYEEDNTLYYTRRDYVLEFVDTTPVLLQKTTVKGIQKMILNDSVSFSVESSYSSH
jgi:hypothetical protein